MYKLLMVDDDKAILETNQQYFEKMGYEVVCAEDAATALDLVRNMPFDCVILDVDLPGQSGFDVCAQIRDKSFMPVVFLSCYTEEQSRIKGLMVGGDDYVCKPYSLQELELRVRARIRGNHTAKIPQALTFGGLTIDAGRRAVAYEDKIGEFSALEFDILYFLARHPNQVFSYEQIFECVWHASMNKGLHTLQVLVARVRQKLNALCPDHEYIQTIRRKGYQFVP